MVIEGWVKYLPGEGEIRIYNNEEMKGLGDLLGPELKQFNGKKVIITIEETS